MPNLIYRKKNDLVSPRLVFSINGSEIILDDGVKTQISDEEFKALQESDEEFKSCLEQNLIFKVEDEKVAESAATLSDEKPTPVSSEETQKILIPETELPVVNTGENPTTTTGTKTTKK